MTKMERWLAYFANKLNQEEREELAMSEAAISKAYDATGTFFLSQQDRLNYINRQMAIMDYNSGMNAAIKQGIKQGEEQTKRSMVLSMLREKISPDVIAKVSGWTVEAILQFAEQNTVQLVSGLA